jgi:ParB-like chromosome segregation protein Spo0J
MPNPRDPRTQAGASVAQTAGSSLAFGVNSPILIDSGANIIAGYFTYLAVLRLGLEIVPVIVLADKRIRRMRANGRVRAGRMRHQGPTTRRKACDHDD